MTKRQQVHELIHNLRERPHVVEFAEKCAKRAESYATCVARRSTNYVAADYAAADAALSRCASTAARAARAATDAADSATNAFDYAADVYDGERDIQIDHLKELHAREESQDL